MSNLIFRKGTDTYIGTAVLKEQCGFFRNIHNPISEDQHLNFHVLNYRIVRLYILEDKQ